MSCNERCVLFVYIGPNAMLPTFKDFGALRTDYARRIVCGEQSGRPLHVLSVCVSGLLELESSLRIPDAVRLPTPRHLSTLNRNPVIQKHRFVWSAGFSVVDIALFETRGAYATHFKSLKSADAL